MAIEGPLHELALPDVLQLLHLSQKTGTLTVRNDGFARAGVVYFDHGAVVGAVSPGESSRLGRLLLMAGKATESQIDGALAEQSRTPDRRIGQILVERQGIPAPEVLRLLRFQIEEAVFELVRWADGYFRFEEASPPDPGPLRVRMPTESLLMEALRRVDEWSMLASGQPDTSLVPRLVESELGPASMLSLQPQEWEVLAGIDGERTLRSIARVLGRGEFDVAKAVYSLVSSGVVELSHRAVRAPAAQRATATVADVPEIEALLRRGEVDAAEQRLDELLTRDPASGELQMLRGRVQAGRGEWTAAVHALESAVRMDPLLSEAYFHLGVALLRVGEFSRAREHLATYAELPDAAPARRAAAARAAGLAAELQQLLEEGV